MYCCSSLSVGAHHCSCPRIRAHVPPFLSRALSPVRTPTHAEAQAEIDKQTRLRQAAEDSRAKTEAELQLVCATLASVRAQLRDMTADRDRLQKLCDELMRRVADLEAQLAILSASGDAQAKYILELEKQLREALDALARERRAHESTRESLTAQVIKEVMEREMTILECRDMVQRRDKMREGLIRQLLERRRAVRVVRLVNRLRHPYHKVDGDFSSEVLRDVQRLVDEGICHPEAIAAMTDTYLTDVEDLPSATAHLGGGGHIKRDALVGAYHKSWSPEGDEPDGPKQGAEGAARSPGGGREGGSAAAGVLVVRNKKLEWRMGGVKEEEEEPLKIMARELGVREDVATRPGLIFEIEKYFEGEGYKDLRYETAQESWEIFARELLCRFEVFWRFSYGLQQYTRAKKRTAVYRTRMEQLLAQRDAHIRDLEAELARMRAKMADEEDLLRKLQLRVKELEERVAELEKALADANWQIEFLNKSLAAKQQEMDMAVSSLQDELAAERRKTADLQKELKEAMQRERGLKDEIIELKRIIEELRRKLDSLKDYDDLRKMVERLTKQLAEKSRECETLEVTNADLRKELELEKGKNQALRMRVETVLKQRDRMMEEAEAREKVLKGELDEVGPCCVIACVRGVRGIGCVRARARGASDGFVMMLSCHDVMCLVVLLQAITKFNRLMAAGGGKRPGMYVYACACMCLYVY